MVRIAFSRAVNELSHLLYLCSRRPHLMSSDPQQSIHVGAGDAFGRLRMRNLPRLRLAKNPHRHGMSEQACNHLLFQACMLGQICK